MIYATSLHRSGTEKSLVELSLRGRGWLLELSYNPAYPGRVWASIGPIAVNEIVFELKRVFAIS